MDTLQTFTLLITAAVLLVGLSQKLRIPYPIALVLGGAAIGFIPGIKAINFNPNFILVMVLPPILYYGAFWISFQEFKRYWTGIFSLALGLVAATTLIIGVIFKWLFPELPWALAFAVGAIVSPPDAGAATTILKRFSMGSRLLTVLEGESLINDASAIVLYKLAVAALFSGVFSFSEGVIEFSQIVIGGVVVGLIIGITLQLFSRRFLDPVVAVVFSFVIPYITYIFADFIGVSGVLAVVVNGLIGSRILITHHSSLRRVLGYTVWDIFIILLNCFIFILVGSQLRTLTENMTYQQILLYSCYGLLITFAMIFVRMVWLFTNSYFYYLRNRYNPNLNLKKILSNGVILGWSGMRGIVSLATALALPVTLSNGELLMGRDIVIFIVFIVILLTLLIPGLTLPTLIEWLKIYQQIPENKSGIVNTRNWLIKKAEEEIEHLHSVGNLLDEERSFLLTYFNVRHRILEVSSLATNGKTHNLEDVRLKVLQAQRQLLLAMWEREEIDDRILIYLEHELDVEETHLGRAEIK